MNVLIFGAGQAGRFLYDEIQKKASDIQIAGFIDNKLSGAYKECLIYRPDDILHRREIYDTVFIAAGAQKTVKIAIDSITAYGIYNIYMLHDIAGKNRLSPFNEKGEIIPWYLRRIEFSDKKPTLPYFEVPITDRCNLNCKGCLFACNMIKGNEDIPVGQIKRDALRMRELFYDIPWIRILGGEPLMHPDITEILEFYRNTFINTEIDLCTNGLILHKMQPDFFEALKKNRITVHVSGYRPTYHILDKIDVLLKNSGINYTILKRDVFSKYYTLECDGNKTSNFEDCIASGCRELYNGKLMRCSGVIAFEKLNEQFGADYKIKEEHDWYDIHRDDIDAWDLKKKIDHASDACGYCNIEKMEEFEWDYAGNQPGIGDYVV